MPVIHTVSNSYLHTGIQMVGKYLHIVGTALPLPASFLHKIAFLPMLSRLLGHDWKLLIGNQLQKLAQRVFGLCRAYEQA